MRPDPTLRVLWLLVVMTAGIIAALGSSSYDGDDDIAAVPIDLSFALTQASANATLEIDVGRLTLSNTRLAGTVNVGSNDRLTVLRNEVMLDATSNFDADVTAGEPTDPLSGQLSLEVTEVIDFGADRTPTTGQFRTEFEGTTTVVTILTSPARASLEIGVASAVEINWSDFENRRDLAIDEGDVDEKAASLAYYALRELWRLGQLTEYVQRDIDANRGDLASMGLNENLELTCDNGVNAGDGQFALRWTADAPGVGEGEAGNGDDFEALFGNCLRSGSDRYHDGDITFTDYEFDDVNVPRTMRYRATALSLFFATEEITFLTVPTDATPRFSGALELFVTPVE